MFSVAMPADALFVAAAGNEGSETGNVEGEPTYPAHYAEQPGLECVLTVGASNDRDTLSSFSNYGEVLGQAVLSMHEKHLFISLLYRIHLQHTPAETYQLAVLVFAAESSFRLACWPLDWLTGFSRFTLDWSEVTKQQFEGSTAMCGRHQCGLDECECRTCMAMEYHLYKYAHSVYNHNI